MPSYWAWRRSVTAKCSLVMKPFSCNDLAFRPILTLDEIGEEGCYKNDPPNGTMGKGALNSIKILRRSGLLIRGQQKQATKKIL